MPYKIIPHTEGPGVYAEIGNILVFVAHEPPTKPSMGVLSRHVTRMQQTYGDNFGLLIMVHGGSVPPSELRKPLADFFGTVMRRGKGVALAILSAGFMASVQRSIATGLTLASGHGKKMRAFASVDEAITWLAGAVGRSHETMNWVEAGQRLLEHCNDERNGGAQSATGS